MFFHKGLVFRMRLREAAEKYWESDPVEGYCIPGCEVVTHIQRVIPEIDPVTDWSLPPWPRVDVDTRTEGLTWYALIAFPGALASNADLDGMIKALVRISVPREAALATMDAIRDDVWRFGGEDLSVNDYQYVLAGAEEQI